MLEYILSFFAFWVGKIFTLFLNIIPIGWILWILHLFDIDFSLSNTLDLYLLFFTGLLTFVIISKVILEKISLVFFRSADGIGLIGIFIKWLVGLISFKEFAKAMNMTKNIVGFIISLFVIVSLYMINYKGITTFSNLVDYTFYKTDAKEVSISHLTGQTFSQLAIKYQQYSGQKLNTETKYQYSGNQLVFKLNLTTGDLITGNLINNIGKYTVFWTYQLKHGFEISKKRIHTIDVGELIASGGSNLLNQKEEYQKYFLLLTMNLDKKPDYLKTYYFMGFPLEPISFSSSTNFLYLLLLTLIILSFWAMILAISPLMDLMLVIFIKRSFDYWDIIGMFLRLFLAVWLWYQLFYIK